MSNTLIPAAVEIAYRKRRGRTVNTNVVTHDDGALVVSQKGGEIALNAKAYALEDAESGQAFAILSRENATTLCRNLAVRLGLTIKEEA